MRQCLTNIKVPCITAFLAIIESIRGDFEFDASPIYARWGCCVTFLLPLSRPVLVSRPPVSAALNVVACNWPSDFSDSLVVFFEELLDISSKFKEDLLD